MLNRELGWLHVLVVNHGYLSSLGVFDITGFIIITYFFQQFYTVVHVFIDEGPEPRDEQMILPHQFCISNVHNIFHRILDNGMIGSCRKESIENGVDGLECAHGYKMFCADDCA